MRPFAAPALLAAALAACAAEPPAASPDPDAPIERTVVVLRADGADVTTTTVTAAQRDAELATRQAIARGERPALPSSAARDTGCANASMWIFDNANYDMSTPPLNHEICFYRGPALPSCADLRQYTRQCLVLGGTLSCQTWASAAGNWIGSYAGGIDYGAYRDAANNVVQYFGRWAAEPNAQAVIPRAAQICF